MKSGNKERFKQLSMFTHNNSPHVYSDQFEIFYYSELLLQKYFHYIENEIDLTNEIIIPNWSNMKDLSSVSQDLKPLMIILNACLNLYGGIIPAGYAQFILAISRFGIGLENLFGLRLRLVLPLKSTFSFGQCYKKKFSLWITLLREVSIFQIGVVFVSMISR